MRLDEKNKNSKWQQAETLELNQLDEYSTFDDRGKNGKVPTGYKKIQVHLVYDIKHDGRHKARLVAGGHLTDVPMESVYSGVVSLYGLHIVLFLAELNKLEVYSTDIGNAYLEAQTSERCTLLLGQSLVNVKAIHLLFSRLYMAYALLGNDGMRNWQILS